MIDLNSFTEEMKRLDKAGYAHAGVTPALVLELLAQLALAQKDAARLDFIQEATVDVRCVEQAEDSYGWEVIEHHMAAPKERKIGGSFNELGLRDAIDAAMEAKP